MPTKDKLYISVDLFARWRIADPLQYFLRLHDERSAQSRLDDILGSETRNAVAKHELIEIIRTTKDRVPLRDTLLTGAGRVAGDACRGATNGPSAQPAPIRHPSGHSDIADHAAQQRGDVQASTSRHPPVDDSGAA